MPAAAFPRRTELMFLRAVRSGGGTEPGQNRPASARSRANAECGSRKALGWWALGGEVDRAVRVAAEPSKKRGPLGGTTLIRESVWDRLPRRSLSLCGGREPAFRRRQERAASRSSRAQGHQRDHRRHWSGTMANPRSICDDHWELHEVHDNRHH